MFNDGLQLIYKLTWFSFCFAWYVPCLSGHRPFRKRVVGFVHRSSGKLLAKLWLFTNRLYRYIHFLVVNDEIVLVNDVFMDVAVGNRFRVIFAKRNCCSWCSERSKFKCKVSIYLIYFHSLWCGRWNSYTVICSLFRVTDFLLGMFAIQF
jgi:hypothetical protein